MFIIHIQLATVISLLVFALANYALFTSRRRLIKVNRSADVGLGGPDLNPSWWILPAAFSAAVIFADLTAVTMHNQGMAFCWAFFVGIVCPVMSFLFAFGSIAYEISRFLAVCKANR